MIGRDLELVPCSFALSFYAFPRARGGAERAAGNPGRAVGRGAADFPFLQIGWRRRRGLRYGVSFADIGSQHYGHDNPSTIVRSDVSRLTLAFMLHEARKA